jgi:hypothetical protein
VKTTVPPPIADVPEAVDVLHLSESVEPPSGFVREYKVPGSMYTDCAEIVSTSVCPPVPAFV